MIIKESQLQHCPYTKEWPITLTPEQREQLLRDKIVRMQAWYRRAQQQHEYINDFERG